MEKDMLYYVQICESVMQTNLKRRKELTAELCRRYKQSGRKKLCVIASGSSLNAALAAENFMNRYSENPVVILSPSDYMDYHREDASGSFVVVISQSGCSTNIIAAVKILEADAIPSVALTGNPEGNLKNYTIPLIEYGVGNETIDYVTLGYVTLIEYLLLFVMEIGLESGYISDEEYMNLVKEIEICCHSNMEMYRESKRFTKQYYRELLQMEKVIIVSDGANMGTAREAALKFQETLKIPAVYYESEEYIHGPNMQLTPDYTVFFIDTNQRHNRMREIFEATSVVTEHTYMVTNKKTERKATILSVENMVRNELTPLFTVVLFQYISAVITKEKNNFKCHPLFGKFEEKIHCKTSDYEAVMNEKIRKSKEVGK